MALEDAAHDRRPVGLDTRRRALRTALPSQDVLLEILLRKLQTSRNTVHHHTDEFPVGLTEDAYPEFSTECIHIIELYLFFYPFPDMSLLSTTYTNMNPYTLPIP